MVDRFAPKLKSPHNQHSYQSPPIVLLILILMVVSSWFISPIHTIWQEVQLSSTSYMENISGLTVLATSITICEIISQAHHQHKYILTGTF